MSLGRRDFVQAIWAALALQSAPGIALANVQLAARTAFLNGRWNEPSVLLGNSNDPDGLAFAARALLAGALLDLPTRQRGPAAQRAKGLCEQALQITPRHVEARLQLCIALAMLSRLRPLSAALTARIPQRSLAIMRGVVADEPNEPWGYALIGGWHLEVIRLGGFAGKSLLGASLEAGKAAYTRALALSPSEPVIPFSCAASLIGIDPLANAADIQRLLERARGANAEGMFESGFKARAANLANLVNSGNISNARNLVALWL